MLKATDLYIDLGTANTLIYARNKGFVLNQPSVIALRERYGRPQEMQAIGDHAKKMIGRNPQNLAVLRPLKEGVIADFKSTSLMLHQFIRHLREKMFLLKPRMIISLPCQVTNYEKIAVQEVGHELGAGSVHLLHEPVAAAIGAGMPVLEKQGSMIVDIGGGTTEIAVIAMGGIITAKAIRLGGANIDAEIISLLHSEYRIAIGDLTAEKIKISIGSAIDLAKSIEVAGTDLSIGLPRRFKVTAKMIRPAIDRVIAPIILAVKNAMEECPPEIYADIAQNGITLAGGGALIHGIAERLSTDTGVPVHIAYNPLLSVATGGAMAIENSKLFEALEQPR